MDYIRHLIDEHVLEMHRTLLLWRWASAVGTIVVPLAIVFLFRHLNMNIMMSLGLAGFTSAILIFTCIKLTGTIKIIEAEIEKRRL